MDSTLTELGRGLRLVHVHDRHTVAATFGVAVRAGSSDEERGRFGLAHFVEHTIFKGTATRNSWHIINRMEAVGGELNAYTTKESTVVYSAFPTGAESRAIELIADLILNSRFPEKELDKEREVVLDEINSYLDSPADAVYDDYDDLIFAGTGLGHNILGTPKSVAALTGADCRAFLDRYYHGPNMVVFYSGPISPDRIARAVERRFAGISDAPVPRSRDRLMEPDRFDVERRLPVHQSHVVLGNIVPGTTERQRYAASLLANIVAGPGMNSLLNVELRERRGLVYNVEASISFSSQGGLFTVYFGCDEADRARCKALCLKAFAELADGSVLTPRRLERARKQYIGQAALALENRENRILEDARGALFYGAPKSYARFIENVNELGVDDLRAVAQILTKPASLSFIPA